MIKITWKDYINIAIVLIAIIVCFFYLPARKKKALAGIESIATITDKGIKNIIFYSYEFNDSIYNSSEKVLGYSEYRKYKVGQKFKVFVDPQDPSNSEIVLDKPIIDR